MTLIVSESGIYKLKDSTTDESQNLSPESRVNPWALSSRYEGKWDDLYTSNNGGTAEAKFFRPLIQDE